MYLYSSSFFINFYLTYIICIIQHLDEDSQAGLRRIMARDAQIDEGLDAIGKSVDRLGSIAAAINETVHYVVIVSLMLRLYPGSVALYVCAFNSSSK